MTPEALSRLVDSPWKVILDTWPGEPFLSADLLSRCDWVSPHIAGHSIKARENGSDLLASAVARWAGVEARNSCEPMDHEGCVGRIEPMSTERGVADSEATLWMTEFLCQHSILPREDARLREAGKAGLSSIEFDHLRKSYQQPAEWTGQHVTIPGNNVGLRAAAERLGLEVASE